MKGKKVQHYYFPLELTNIAAYYNRLWWVDHQSSDNSCSCLRDERFYLLHKQIQCFPTCCQDSGSFFFSLFCPFFFLPLSNFARV